MSRLHHSDYPALDLNGDNYLDWAMNTSADLKSKGLGKCIKYGNDTLAYERRRAVLIMRKHLVKDLYDECSYINDPYDLWSRLNTMFLEPLLDESMKEWKALRFQDYESVDDYHFDLMRITYSLKLCGEVITNYDLLSKTRDTIHSKEVLLSQKAKGFTTYYDLLSYLSALEEKKQKRKVNLDKLDYVMEISAEYQCEMIYGDAEEIYLIPKFTCSPSSTWSPSYCIPI
ncbi:uncharacterized protein LOC130495619 [Raphanus sativus]|uniref:Uncharacterized protein LOC130495619 n=1 Tax=Raphanus sativus TaxID=3726 RepID=A0A9W3BUV3_RAPSA|nr:uncharacterized protein LOC130495619 [Raphanus sativus]